MQTRLRFTLRDLIVAVVVISFGLVLLTPWIHKARDEARLKQCTNNLRQIGIALHNYHDGIRCMPMGIVADSPDLRVGSHSAWIFLVPYCESSPIYNYYNFTWPWSDPVNHTAIAYTLEFYVCPANRPGGVLKDAGLVAGVSDYGLSKGAAAFLCLGPDSKDFPKKLQGYFDVNSHVQIRDVKDGTANTIMVGEIAGGPGFEGVTSNGTRVRMDQAWAKADFDEAVIPTRGGAGSVLAVTAQRPFPLQKDWWWTAPVWAQMNAHPLTVSRDASPDSSCRNLNDRVNEFRSVHRDGVNFLFGDGTVRFVDDSVDRRIYSALGTISGNEMIVDGDSF